MRILCFGEPMIRLAPPSPLFIEQTDTLDLSFVGAEVVVATSLALQGDDVAFTARLSTSHLGDRAVRELRRHGIDTQRICRVDDRMGIYFIERGASRRPDVVIYDRANTAMAHAAVTDFDWDSLLNGVWCFYFSGVCASISPALGDACEQALIACKGRGIKTFCDLNFRHGMISETDGQRLWERLLPYVDVVIGSTEDYEALGLVEPGAADDPRLRDGFADRLFAEMGCTHAALNHRTYDPMGTLEMENVLATPSERLYVRATQPNPVEVAGSGDAFAAGIVHGLMRNWDLRHTLDYATAAALFKTTVVGEHSYADELDIERFIDAPLGPTIVR